MYWYILNSVAFGHCSDLGRLYIYSSVISLYNVLTRSKQALQAPTHGLLSHVQCRITPGKIWGKTTFSAPHITVVTNCYGFSATICNSSTNVNC